MSFIVIDIGCIECGESSDIVGVFDDKEFASALATKCQEKYGFTRGQHNFEVFELPKMNEINPSYEVS